MIRNKTASILLKPGCLNDFRFVEKLLFRCKHSHSANIWLERQRKDPYVRQAKVDMYRSRAAYKLLDLDSKYNLFKPGDFVVDCGAAPGAWSQVAAEKVMQGEKQGTVIGLDVEQFSPVDDCIAIPNCDVTNLEATLKLLKNFQPDLKGCTDVLLSDMAPSVSGQSSLDHDRSVRLCLAAIRLGTDLPLLKNGAHFVCKLLGGRDNATLKGFLQKQFEKVVMHKPASSRKDSSEIFIVAINFQSDT